MSYFIFKTLQFMILCLYKHVHEGEFVSNLFCKQNQNYEEDIDYYWKPNTV